MSARASTLLTSIQTLLRKINGTTPYANTFTSASVMLRTITREGMEIETNELKTRPCIIIALESLDDTQKETIDEYEIPFTVRIDTLLGGTVSELNITELWADVRYALASTTNHYGVGVKNESLSLRRLDQNGDLLAIDGARFIFSGQFTELLRDPDNG